MNAVELFCGMGVSSLGLTATKGVKLRGAIDNHKPAVQAFNSQPGLLPPVAVLARVGQVEWDFKVDFHLTSGGPPCKAFSPGATLFGTKGKRDKRNEFPSFMAEVEKYLPPYVMIENSFALSRFAGYVGEIVGHLLALGYAVDVQEVQCYDFGIPQFRQRLVFLASRKKAWKVKLPKRRLAGPETVGDVMYDPPAHDPWPLVVPLSKKGLAYYLRDPQRIKKHRPLQLDEPANTITATYSKGVPYGVVEIDGDLYSCQPRLAARLQGVPDEYDLSVISKTQALMGIGNGFPPQVVHYLLKGL